MKLFAYTVIAVEVGTLIVGGFRYRNLPRPLRILVWLIAFNIGLIGLEFIIASGKRNNLWLTHVSTIVEYVLIVFIFSSWIKHKTIRFVLMSSLPLFIVLWIVGKFTFEPLSFADDLTSTISKVLQISFSAYLLIIIVKDSDIAWRHDSRFWIAASVIIYAAGSLFIFALFNKMVQVSPDFLRMIWPLNWILAIISNLFFTLGFLCKE
jgi:hypothetical protein